MKTYKFIVATSPIDPRPEGRLCVVIAETRAAAYDLAVSHARARGLDAAWLSSPLCATFEIEMTVPQVVSWVETNG